MQKPCIKNPKYQMLGGNRERNRNQVLIISVPRLHPATCIKRNRRAARKKHVVDLTYHSWAIGIIQAKRRYSKSGIATNIGVHFDMLMGFRE
jgi:hypothetical protein